MSSPTMSETLVLAFACGWMVFQGGSSGLLWKEYAYFQIIRNFCVAVIFLWLVGFGVITTNESVFFDIIPVPRAVQLNLFSDKETFLFLSHLSNLWLFVSMGTLSVLERGKDEYVLAQSVWDAAIVYPLIAFWTNNQHSWLVKDGFVDERLGSVFLAGGIAALVCTRYIGVRRSNFVAPENRLLEQHDERDVATNLLGIFLMFIGTNYFHCSAGRVNTVALLLCVCGSLTYVILRRRGIRDLLSSCLVGLVLVGGAQLTNVVWPSIVLGFLGAAAYDYTRVLATYFLVDDPYEFCAMQIVPSIFGLLCIGISGNTRAVSGLVDQLHSSQKTKPLQQILVQLAGILLCGVFSAVMKFIFLILVDVVYNIRVDGETETFGFNWCNSLDTAHERSKLSRDLWKIFSQNPSVSTTLCAEFHRYLETRFCGENWDFLVAYAEFRARSEHSSDHQFRIARERFYSLYLEPGSEKEINISTGARSAAKREKRRDFCMLAEKEIRDLLWHHFKDFARGNTKDLLLLRDHHNEFSTFLKRNRNELELMNQSSLWRLQVGPDWQVSWNEVPRQQTLPRTFSLSNFGFACGGNRDGASTPSVNVSDLAMESELKFEEPLKPTLDFANSLTYELNRDFDISHRESGSRVPVPDLMPMSKSPALAIRVESRSMKSTSQSPILGDATKLNRETQQIHTPDVPTPSELELPPLALTVSSTQSSENIFEVNHLQQHFDKDELVILSDP